MNISREIKHQFYMSKEWKTLRNYKIKIAPMCECDLCKDVQQLIADEVHHIIDIDKDWNRRLDLDNLMSVNKTCHSRITMENNQKEKKKIKESQKYDRITNRLINISLQGGGSE